MLTRPTANEAPDDGTSLSIPSDHLSAAYSPALSSTTHTSPQPTRALRSPLAPLPPQLPAMPADPQRRSPAGPSASAYGWNDNPNDRSPGGKSSSKFSGHIISNQSIYDVEAEQKSPGLQPHRRKATTTQSPAATSSRGALYPRPASRRNSRASTSSSSSRRTSLPALHLRAPNTAAAQLGSMSSGSMPTPTEDLYSNLSAYSFGTANTAQPYDADTEMVGPLQAPGGAFVRRPSADHTPRPSFSGASTFSRRRAAQDEDEPDDAAFVRRMSRGKIRAIDIGARRPSLPTNVLDATSDPSSDPTSSASDIEHDYTASDGGLDTDVELDPDIQRPEQQILPGHPHRARAPRMIDSDVASVNTFGGGSDRYERRSTYSRREESSEDDEYGVVQDKFATPRPASNVPGSSMAPTSHHDLGQPPSPKQHRQPWTIPEVAIQGPPDAPPVAGPSRQREESSTTLRGPNTSQTQLDARSSDESSNAVTFVGPPPSEEPASEVYEGLDLEFIYSGTGRRPSVVTFDPRASGQTVRDTRNPSSGFSFGWGKDLRRGSAATTASGGGGSDDAFMKHLREQDPQYQARVAEWSFRKEKAEGQRDLTRVTSTATHTSDARGKPIQIGLQEIWRCEYVGRFKVDRVMWPPEEPGRPQQQRLNTRHFADPYSKGYHHGGPSGLIHKHTRAVAFSIFREHDLQTIRRHGSGNMSMAMGVLLAPRRVQEQYTSTKTTSKLNDHGLLQDRPGRTSTSSSVRRRSPSRARKETSSSGGGKDKKEKREKDKKGKERARQDSPQVESETPSTSSKSRALSLSSQSRGTSAPAEHRPSPPPLPSSGPKPSPSPSASASTLASEPTRPPSPDSVSRTSSQATSFDTNSNTGSPVPSGAVAASPSPLFTPGAGPSYPSHPRQDSMNMDEDYDDEMPHRITSHKEAFGTLDVDVLEQMQRGQTHDGGLSVIKRKWFGGGKSRPAGAQGAQNMGLGYDAPWLTLASRQDVEQQERTIARLNNSFKDVGLLPTIDPKKSRKGKSKQPSGNSRRPDEDVFKPVPDDALFMLLPLWPKDSDVKSDNDVMYEVPFEQRQFLLIYYRREEAKKKQKKRAPPGAQGSSAPSHIHHEAPDDPSQLRTFHVCARVLGYEQLRLCGVRCPSHGLAVTGTMRDAFHSIPPPEVREREYDPLVIALWHSRETGLELVTEPLDKLGLCQARTPDLDPDDAPPLTPIGRAAAEMAWLGAMALTSFGPV